MDYHIVLLLIILSTVGSFHLSHMNVKPLSKIRTNQHQLPFHFDSMGIDDIYTTKTAIDSLLLTSIAMPDIPDTHTIKTTIDTFLSTSIDHTQSIFHHFASLITSTSIDIPEINMVDEKSSLNPLGKDLLVFLFATIGIVPLFKWLNASPVIGFLVAGLIMGPAGLGLFSDLNDMESIADFGVLFLLFEQGLELTVDRLNGLSKYAFGMGTLQVLLCSFSFFIFPFIGGVQFLEFISGSKDTLVEITRIDEALVIGMALSLSSSAFCLKILQEKNQLTTSFGAASLGILLFQDIAVVPLLVLLPIIESQTGSMTLADQAAILGVTFAKALFGLGGILLFGGRIVRFLFSLVAQSKSSETFVALCLVVALGTGALTDWLGLSSTLGAFTAGTLLAESNYRTQIETDIKPFRGLLLGLFFITTGASVEPGIIQEELPIVIALLAGLISFKASIVTCLGPFFGLSKTESVRTGMLLSGGGEFAFVVLTLADKLHVLPDKLAKILVGVVVLSMALTPYLSMLGDKIASFLETYEQEANILEATQLFEEQSNSAATAKKANLHDSIEEAVVICGFGNLGSNIAAFLSDPSIQNNFLLSSGGGGTEYNNGNNINGNNNGGVLLSDTDSLQKQQLQAQQQQHTSSIEYVAFDLDPTIVINGFKNGKRVLYGDGSQPLVLLTAGVTAPRAFVITYPEQSDRVRAVETLRQAYPSAPIISRTSEVDEYYQLLEAGASAVCVLEREASYNMFASLLTSLNINGNNNNNVGNSVNTFNNNNVPTPLLALAGSSSGGMDSSSGSNSIVNSYSSASSPTSTSLPSLSSSLMPSSSTSPLSLSSTSSAVAGLSVYYEIIRQFRLKAEQTDEEELLFRSNEKSGWSADGNRVNIPDTAYFNVFKNGISSPFSENMTSMQYVLNQVAMSFKGVLGNDDEINISSDEETKKNLNLFKKLRQNNKNSDQQQQQQQQNKSIDNNNNQENNNKQDMTIDVSASLLQETMKTSATTSSATPTPVNFNNSNNNKSSKNKNRNQDNNADNNNDNDSSTTSTDAEFTMVTASEAALYAETANMSKILSAVSENEGVTTEIELGVTICKLPTRSDKEKDKERK